MKVEPGGLVEKGQVIGLAGNTGASTTGPHIHYGVYLHGNWIDPLAWQALTESLGLGP
ncbi:MAG: M23 family metallopeptidase [Thermodesulfobacteriota bacterium]